MQVIIALRCTPEKYVRDGLVHRVRSPPRCPGCGARGPLRAHDYYPRATTDSSGHVITIRVRRYLCRKCGVTVGCLPSFVQPYRLVNSATIEKAFLGDCRSPDVLRHQDLAGTFVAVKLFGTAVNNVSYYNCTGGSFVNNATGTAPAFNLRYVNCLAIANGSGFAANTQLANCPELYRSQCVSVDGTATDTYVSEQCLSGNAVNQPVSLLSVATNGDYRLAPTDTGASGKGGPGLGADITGAARTGPAYDAGAYQLPNHAPLISGGPWATPNPVNTNTAVMFTTLASDLDGNALSCTWTFGDSGSASGINVTYTYISLGVYTARVVGSDGQLAATGSVVVSVATGSVASAVSAFDTWRIAHFGSTNAVGAGASDDPLQVGMNNLQKYLLGMDPNDPNSTYKMLRIQPLSSSNGVWWYGGTTNTGFINLFAVETCTNLGGTGWGAKATGLPNSATGTNVWWDTNLPASVPIFYRITTQLNMP